MCFKTVEFILLNSLKVPWDEHSLKDFICIPTILCWWWVHSDAAMNKANICGLSMLAYRRGRSNEASRKNSPCAIRLMLANEAVVAMCSFHEGFWLVQDAAIESTPVPPFEVALNGNSKMPHQPNLCSFQTIVKDQAIDEFIGKSNRVIDSASKGVLMPIIWAWQRPLLEYWMGNILADVNSRVSGCSKCKEK